MKILKYRYVIGLIFLCAFIQSIHAQSYHVSIQYVGLEKGDVNPLKSYESNVAANTKVSQNDFIVLSPEVSFQTIEGVGGAFNEQGGEALLSLGKKEQSEISTVLFSPAYANLSFNRSPVGASDFALEAYSYSMKPGDYQMEYFSIERDKRFLIPFIKSALSVNPEMMLQVSPWSPPAWMKESGKMDANNKEPEKSRLKFDQKTHKAYALYLSKYVKAYQENGIKIHRLCVQNEPDTYAPFPGCNMTMTQMEDLTLGYIIPEFKKLDTEVWLGTFRTINRADHHSVSKWRSLKGVAGIGFQYAGGEFIQETNILLPKLKIMSTEGNCFHGQNSKEQAMTRLGEVANYINAGSVNYCYWNMILNETSRSAWGWKQNSLLVVDRNSKEVTYTPDYNALYLIAHSLRKGDVRIGHISKYPVISVKDKLGNIKVLIQNDQSKAKLVKFFINNEEMVVQLPAEKLCLITIKK